MELKVHDQEILLQRYWKKKAQILQNFRTLSQKQVEILYAGNENLDAGPDFQDAVLKIDGILLKGDVEVHLNFNGWYAHGHHQDPKYNNVILHLVAQPPKKESYIEREDGVLVEQVYFPISSVKKDLWKTKKKQPPAVPIVADCPLSHKDRLAILAIVEAAGRERLREKVEQIAEEVDTISWDEILYRKIMESLGYSKNREPFRKLAINLPFSTIRQEMQFVSDEESQLKSEALLFGASGLLPALTDRKLNSEARTYCEPLIVRWQKYSHKLNVIPLRKESWQFFRLRPQNFPTRRLAGMALILQKFVQNGFLDGFLRIVESHIQDARKLRTELEESLVQSSYGFWEHHYRFEEESKTANSSAVLIGTERARDIVLNTVIPVLYLYSRESQTGALLNTLKELYLRYLKTPENEITRAMMKQLNLGGRKAKLTLAMQQQGLIQLHKLYCPPLRCDTCLNLNIEEIF